MLDRLFKLRENGTTVQTELVAGLTTFLTMVYIVMVNPSILSETGMDKGAIFTATCLAAAFGSFIMGALANYPIALAPGMGMNAFFTFTVVKSMGYTWEIALGCVFVSGVLFILISIFKIREWVINAVPLSLKMSTAAGIGIFLGFIALKGAGIVVPHPETFVTLGDMTKPAAILTSVGFIAIVVLSYFHVRSAIIIVMLAVTAVSILLGMTHWQGDIIALPPSLAPTFMQMDLTGVFFDANGLLTAALLPVVFTLLFLDLFDTAGTLIGTGHAAGFLTNKGVLPRIGPALLADSTATVAGAVLGTSNTTAFIESLAGIKVGGRTGLTAIATAAFFLLILFFSPIALMVPPYATAAALLYVACLMARSMIEIDWEDLTEYAPALITVISMPLTFSIANGIGFGFISYALIKIFTGRARDCSLPLFIVAFAFALKFAFL